MKNVLANTKPVFIDFGPGKKDNAARQAKQQGFFTIGLDYSEREEHSSDNWAFDRMIYGPWEVAKLTQKAAAWRCSSCLEHTKQDDVEEAVAGIARLINPKSNGKIHIDLTDHRGGFTHYQPGHIWTDPNRRSGTYLNTVRIDDWYTLVDKYLIIAKCELMQKHGGGHPTAIDFWIAGVK